MRHGIPAKGLKVVSMELAGYAYHNGRKSPGWTIATLENGEKVYLGDDTVKGFDGACDAADRLGFNTAEYRKRLDVWVQTGQFPPIQTRNLGQDPQVVPDRQA